MYWPPEFSDIFSRLLEFGIIPQSPNHYKSRCPSHDDTVRSLSVVVGDRGVGVKCHANKGCTFASIAESLGLPQSRFFWEHKDKRQGRMKEVCSYDYRDENMNLLYQSVRYADPKDFKQRRPAPGNKDEMTWDMKGVRYVLYHTEILCKADPKRPVFVVEGEKSADRLIKQLGLISTTNVGGAGKWRYEYCEQLRGRKVLILHDVDRVDKKTGVRPGWEHARKVANALNGIAESVKVITLPGLVEGEDVDDWLDKFPPDAEKAKILNALKAAETPVPFWVPIPDFAAFDVSALGANAVKLSRAMRGQRPTLDLAAATGILRLLYLAAEKAVTDYPKTSRETLERVLGNLAAGAIFIGEDLGKPVEAPEEKPEANGHANGTLPGMEVPVK